MEYGNDGNSQVKDMFYLDILAGDDEDYAYDGQGSGSGEYSTTRPKREMTEGPSFSLIMDVTTTSGSFVLIFS